MSSVSEQWQGTDPKLAQIAASAVGVMLDNVRVLGDAGTAGAPGAVMNAINDALAPFGLRVTSQPFTPEKILPALGKV